MRQSAEYLSAGLAAVFAVGILLAFALVEPPKEQRIVVQHELDAEEELKDRQGSNGAWTDAGTTALSSYAILSAGANGSAGGKKSNVTWTNEDGYPVSIANATVPNSMYYLDETSNASYHNGGGIDWDNQYVPAESKFAYEFGSSSETKAFYLLAFSEYSRVNGTVKMNINETVSAMISTQYSNGSWNDSIYETALAMHALAQVSPHNDSSLQRGYAYIRGRESNDHWGGAHNTSVAIIALSDLGYPIDNEIARLAEMQNSNGSFDDVETSSWALMALARSNSSVAKSASAKVAKWLGCIEENSLSDRELAFASLASAKTGIPLKASTIKVLPGTKADYGPYYVAIVIFAALSFAIGLFARLDSRDVFTGVRKDIFDYIRDHPGEHVSAIMHEFKLSPSSVEHHLKVLEKTDQVTCHKDTKFKRYYINGSGLRNTTESYKPIMAVLKNPTSRRVVQFLMINPRSKQKELAVSLGLSPSTINWHANRLRDCQIIAVTKIGKETFYELSQPDVITKVLSIISSETG